MKLVVNGADVEVDDRHAKTPLLWVLRDVLGLHGTKFGCGAGFCAACTVLIDGRNTKSCQTATERAVGKAVTTVEGASGPVVDAVRDAWHRGNVVQCGYCQPGQTLAAVSLLESDPSPDDAKIDEWMSGNLCRCGTYPRIRAAIHEAAGTLAAGDGPRSADGAPGAGGPPTDSRRGGRPGASVRARARGRDDRRVLHPDRDGPGDPHRVRDAGGGGARRGLRFGSRRQRGQRSRADRRRLRQSRHRRDVSAHRSVEFDEGILRPLPAAGAQARARLVAAAAEAWQVPAAEVEVERGVLSHPSGRRASFGELAARAERLPVPEDVRLKDPADFKLIGRRGAVARRRPRQDPRPDSVSRST